MKWTTAERVEALLAIDPDDAHVRNCAVCRGLHADALWAYERAHGDVKLAAAILDAREILFRVEAHMRRAREHPLATPPTPAARLAYYLDESVCRCAYCKQGRKRAKRALALAHGDRALAVPLHEARLVEQQALFAFGEARRYVRRRQEGR
jgi:hypothetical protein